MRSTWWGKELTNLTWGPGEAVKAATTYSYYNASTGGGWIRAIDSIVEPTKRWTKFDYYNGANDSRDGLVYRIYRPWLNSPTDPSGAATTLGRVETYNYTINFDGTMTAPSSKVVAINNVTVGQTTWSYNWSFGAANAHSRYSVTQHDYASASSFLTTTTVAFRPDDAMGFFQNKPHCVTHPDGTKDSYAYYYGTWNAGTQVFTQSDTGEDRLVLVLHGQNTAGTGGTAVSSWLQNAKSWALETTYLFVNLSTISETVIDRTGHVAFSGENIFLGPSSMERISGTARTFNANNLLAQELDMARTVPGAPVAVNYTYSANGQLASQTEIDGSQTAYTYDNQFRVETITSASGGTGNYPAKSQTFSYNLADLKASAQECSCSPAIMTYEYDTAGRILAMFEPKPGGNGAVLMTGYAYDNDRQTTVALPTGATRITNLYVDGQTTSITGTAQVPTYYDYVAASYVITRTTRHGSGTSYPWSAGTIDGLGRVVQERSPQTGWTTTTSTKAVRKTYTYSTTTGQLTKTATTEEVGGARLLPDHLYTYGNLGLLVQEGDDLGSNGSLDAVSTDRITKHSTSFYKDTGGYNGWIRQDITQIYRTNNNGSDLTTTLDRRTRFTRFNNGAPAGNARAIRDVVELDASGRWSVSWGWVNPVARTRQTTIQYQGTGQGSTNWQDGYLSSETSTGGTSKTYAYNGQGLLASVTASGTGAQTSYAYYDGTKYLSSVSQPNGAGGNATTNYTYYWSQTDSTQTTPYRQVRTQDPAGTYSYVDYDAKDNVWRTWGDGAHPTEEVYDGLGRRSDLTTWKSGTSGTTWATSSFTIPETMHWNFDTPTGLPVSKSYPLGNPVQYDYNARGQVFHRTWGRGVVTTYTYDALTGELTQQSYSDGTPTVSYTYNRFGALASANETAVTNRTFAYRSDLKLDHETLDTYFGSRTLTSTYDVSVPGRATGVSYNGSVTVGTVLGYDGGTGRINSVQGVYGGSSATFNLGYAPATDWVQTITQGSFSRTQYLATSCDRLDRVLTQWAGSTRGDFDSGFDSAGRRNSLFRGGSVAIGGNNQHHFDFTARNEVNSEWNDQDSAQHFVYAYDLAANRLSKVEGTLGTTSYTSDTTNKYTAITGLRPESVLTYDGDGNLTHDGTWAYTWDAENRLKTMNRTGQTLTFTYDYAGRRIRKQVTGTGAIDHKYIWSGWTLLAETNSDGYTLQDSFIRGPDFSAAGCGGGKAGGAGGLLGIYSSGLLYYAVPDAMGNVMGYLNTSGSVVASYRYDAYGWVAAQTGSLTSLPVGFASQYTDRESGLVYYGLRYYNGLHGRFLNRDPIEEAGGNNLYAFVDNDPVDRWDVLGLDVTGCTYQSQVLCEYDWETGGIRCRTYVGLNCHWGSEAPQPVLYEGSFSRPSFEPNLGWEHKPWGFDPRAANWGGGYGIDSFDIFGSERSFGIAWQTTPRGRPGTSRSRYPAPRTPNSPGRGIDDFFGPRTGGGERGFSDGPRYGNWGGKNWSGGPSGNGQPIDSSDEAYERHDRCYASCAGKSTTRSGRYRSRLSFRNVYGVVTINS